MPGPFTDAGWGGWFVWRSFSYAIEEVTAAGFDIMTKTMEIDSKAMRKISDDETIVLVAESQAGAYRISMPVRLLFKLA